MNKILVIDDEVNISEGIKESLVSEGYDVEIAEDGALGLKTKRLIAALADIGGRRCFAITTWFEDRLPNRSTAFW